MVRTPFRSRTWTLALRPPTPHEYFDLCRTVGWHEAINFNVAPLSLQRSLHGVTALATDFDTPPTRDEWAVGMGRIVGDGAIYFYIQDIVVRPEWQGMGIGRAIMDTLMQWLRANAPERSFVGLFAAAGRESFYAHYGFLRHPSLTGMFTVLQREQPPDEWE